ncbi:MAG: alpha/beta hydrolase [Microthrixaceae bacterium]|nr:alpha/beta hydrolase [Microthrixaceae bacterium]
MDRRTVGAIAGALGLSAVAAVTGLRVAGHRIRERTRPDIDPLLRTPGGLSHHQIATSDGGSVHVVEAGRGRPVVLLHGVVLQWWVWNPLFHLLSDRFRVIAWDMRGHGGSTPGTDGISMEAIARDLAEVLDHLELRDAVVVGHSMGGMALGRYAVDHPTNCAEHSSGLMFLATAATELTPQLITPYLGASAGVLAGLADRADLPVEWLWRPGNLSASLVRIAFGKDPSAAAIEATRQMVAEVRPATSIEAGRAILDHDLTDRLGDYDGPAMVVVGTDDHLTPPRLAGRLAGLIGQAELVELPDVGHQVMQEAPQRLAELIEGFADAAITARAGRPRPAASPA